MNGHLQTWKLALGNGTSNRKLQENHPFIIAYLADDNVFDSVT